MSSRPGTRPSFGVILAGVVAIAALAAFAVWLVLNGENVVRSFFPPPPASTQAQEINSLYTIVFAIAAVIFFVVEALIIWSVVRYHRRPGDDELPPQTHGHNLAEVAWTVIPTVIVIFLFFVSWQTLNTVEATNPQPDLRVRAVAGQFQWTFDYLADDGETVLFSQTAPTGAEGGLFLPAGQTTHLYLTSPDVIHSFYVPEFLFKRDVVPGIVNEFDLTITADQAGQTYRGQCAELCGTGHRIMIFEVHALAPDQFQTWYDDKITAASATPTPAPSGAPGGPVITITAEEIKFLETQVSAPADTPFTIAFDNRDAGTPHDIDISDSSGTLVFDGEVFNGPELRNYSVPALPAGPYPFICSIHPTLMTGTLTVQ